MESWVCLKMWKLILSVVMLLVSGALSLRGNKVATSGSIALLIAAWMVIMIPTIEGGG